MKNSKMFLFLVASVVGVGFFAYTQLTTTTVYMSNTTIPSGTKITEKMLNDGTIVAKSVPKSLTNESSIKNYKDIVGDFTKYPIGPGKEIFSYDFAGDTDIRNNETLRSQNLESITLDVNKVVGASDTVRINDRINVYTTQEIDLKKFASGETVTLKDLPDDLKKIFMDAGGFKDTDKISVGSYKYNKLLAQNVPVIDVVRDTETSKVTKFVIGVSTNLSENIFLSLDAGKVNMTILPYNEGDYVTKDSKGSIQYIQYSDKNEETIKDNKR